MKEGKGQKLIVELVMALVLWMAGMIILKLEYPLIPIQKNQILKKNGKMFTTQSVPGYRITPLFVLKI